jgi:hypothetical protein
MVTTSPPATSPSERETIDKPFKFLLPVNNHPFKKSSDDVPGSMKQQTTLDSCVHSNQRRRERAARANALIGGHMCRMRLVALYRDEIEQQLQCRRGFTQPADSNIVFTTALRNGATPIRCLNAPVKSRSQNLLQLTSNFVVVDSMDTFPVYRLYCNTLVRRVCCWNSIEMNCCWLVKKPKLIVRWFESISRVIHAYDAHIKTAKPSPLLL